MPTCLSCQQTFHKYSPTQRVCSPSCARLLMDKEQAEAQSAEQALNSGEDPASWDWRRKRRKRGPTPLDNALAETRAAVAAQRTKAVS